MVAVYTQIETDIPKDNAFYGFISRTHFLFSVSYSVICSKKWFDKIILFVDKKSYNNMIPVLDLFDEVVIIDIPYKYGKTWAIGKINTYSVIDTPFVHIDFDAYLLTPYIKIFAERGIIIHQKELSDIHLSAYMKQFECIKGYNNSMLSYFNTDIIKQYCSYACGVLGTYNYKLINTIYLEVIEFVRSNNINEDLSLSLEQGYLSMYLQGNNFEVYEALTQHKTLSEQLKEMKRKGYIHLVGNLKKKDKG